MVNGTVKKENKKEAKGKKAEFPRMRPDEGTMTVVDIARTAKVVKGGKRFGFRALVVVGNGKGRVGASIGKANQVQLAIAKAESKARKEMMEFPIVGETVPHETIGKFGSATVWMKPAAPGTGVIAGAGVRLVLEAAGIKNILAKSLGSTNSCNLVYATLEALSTLRTKESVEIMKGKAETPAAAVSETEKAPISETAESK
jgi:small subunit ribosomal protein S5